MDDLKSRLKFDDINIKSRCLQKLLNIVKKKTKGSIINSSSVQVPELSLILETCEDESPVTSNLAVQAIVSLVINKSMYIEYAINKLLGCMKAPSNYQSVINGVSTLLISEFNLATDDKIPKYSLLFPKHPLIAALEDKEDCFPFILEALTGCISLDCERSIQVMKPVICYILCNPSQKQGLDYLKVLFLEAFVKEMNSSTKVLQLAFKYVPFMQIESLHKTIELSLFVNKLNDCLLKISVDEPEFSHLFELSLLASFSLLERSINFGHNPCEVIELLNQLCSLLPKMDESVISINICLMLLGYSLKSASGNLIDKICALGMILLENARIFPTVAAVVALSVIHLLPEPSVISFNDSVKTLLSKFLKKLESVYIMEITVHDRAEQVNDANIQVSEEEENRTFNFLESFTGTIQTSVTFVEFSNLLDKCGLSFKLNWLKSVKLCLDSTKNENYEIIYSLVMGLFLMCPEDEEFFTSCLDVLESLLMKSPNLSTRAFSILIYKMSCVNQPRSKFLILQFLPRSAVHKYSVPPVLGVLQMMAKETDLKAQAIYLMLQLWKRQTRCFPYLHTLLSENTKSFTFDSGVNEILIAQAASILEICSIEPEKHGHEFLNALSAIFNKCIDEASTPVACLAINGIITLCKSEVIDIRSTWKALAAKLNRDKRVMVSCQMYELLSLVPELRVKSYDYDKFMSETVASIWKQISMDTLSPRVLAEAYNTLSKFPMDCHVLKQLPAAAKANLKLPSSMKATPFEMSKLPEDVLSYIPGYCFIDLLLHYEDKVVLEGYVLFLQSLLKMEVDELPRSAYSQTRHVAKRKKVSEALSKVPEFLCTHFHSRKSPALQKNLAVGVLFCYEPPIECGKDGLPIKRSIASQGRSYEQVLTVLLNEVNIDTTEWHRCILISGAWGAFMDRALFACEEARKAELELQRAHGHLDVTVEELNEQCKLAWLWVRERFMSIIKTNVKNTSTAHANAIFAICGLVYALDKFYKSLDDSSKTLAEESDKYVIHRHFMAEHVESVICAMHPEYTPTGKVHSWLLTHLSRPNSSAAYLVTGCAISSLCHLAPILINHYMDDLPNLLEIMLQNVCHSSPVLSFYSGKGVGLLIKSLCEVGYTERGKTQVDLLLHVVKELMKMCEDSEGSLSSALIGLTFSLTSLSQVMDDTIKDWVSTTCDIFYEKLMDEEKSSMQFEMLCICVTAMLISGCEGSCIPIQKVEDLASWIEMNRLELPQCSGISVSLGMLIEAFERFGHSDGAEMKQKVLKGWFNTVTSERKPTLQKIAALNGLCSLFSCGRGLLQVKSQPATESVSALNDLLPVMFQILSATRDTGLQSICSWEVGRLFAVHSNQQQVESSVSASYSYLGEKSILKPVMNIVLSYQKEDEDEFKYCHVLACLKSLAFPFPRPLPPINWVSILTPFLQQSEDSETLETALKIAIYQCNGSSHAMNVISSYCNPPLIHTLPYSSFKILLDNIPALTLALPPAKMQVFMQTVIAQTVKKDDMLKTIGDITLQGLLKSLKQTGYKEQSKTLLQDAYVSILKYFKTNEIYMSEYLPWITDCLLLLPEEVQSSLLSVSENVDDVACLSMIWCHLVKIGKKPLSSLRPCIEEGKCCSSEDPCKFGCIMVYREKRFAEFFKQKIKICTYIYNSFLCGSHNEESEISQPSQCISWLLETIGWIRVLEDTKSKYQLLSTNEVYIFLVDICFATIAGCSGLESSYILQQKKTIDHHSLLKSLSQAVRSLSFRNQWNTVLDKIIDWLLMLLKSQHIKENEKYFIKLSLCSIRNCNHFQRKEIWTDAICNIVMSE